jgi:hypothetical protein
MWPQEVERIATNVHATNLHEFERSDLGTKGGSPKRLLAAMATTDGPVSDMSVKPSPASTRASRANIGAKVEISRGGCNGEHTSGRVGAAPELFVIPVTIATSFASAVAIFWPVARSYAIIQQAVEIFKIEIRWELFSRWPF